MKITYLGSGEFGIDSLNALAYSNHNQSLIVTGWPQPAGRGRKPKPTPVADWAAGRTEKIPLIETNNINTPEIIAKIAECEPDLIVVIAFGQKIGNELINLPPKGAINVHASLLPKFRGAAPINWAIINGQKQTGISIIALAEKMDAGDILAQTETDIAEDETADLLHNRLAQMAGPLLVETIDKIADGTVAYTPQDHSKATLAPKLKKSDGFLDFSESALILRRKILGFWPWPGACAVYISKKSGRREQVTLAGAEVIEKSNAAGLPAGTLDKELDVVCGQGALKITKIRPAGGHVMNFADFVNGRATETGDSFTRIQT